ncbi:MAG: hypothetical protein JW913_16940 [Chitinispirillaceae bacterium]|nr:hypothetical protein [Chitinispirillaceae bacterium]
MSASVLEKNDGGQPSDENWYSGVTQEQSPQDNDLNVQVVDKGSSVEFVLPPRTAQFMEMSVIDPKGKLVWKTQSFNKNTIVWHKQTTFGGRVPGGRYTFRMKLGNRQVDGCALVA